MSVIHGTLRPEDLVPAFLDALSDRVEASTFGPGADAVERVRSVAEAESFLGDLERRLDDDGYFDGEELAGMSSISSIS